MVNSDITNAPKFENSLFEQTTATENMANMRFLLQSAAIFVLLLVTVQGNDNGFLSDTGEKAQDLADAASEKLSNAAESVKDAAKSGYDTVSGAAKDAYGSVASKFQDGKSTAEDKAGEAKDYASDKMREGADALDNAKL
ncbi:hypothetical protein Y032_0603g530 [Ancylostoma ceylanicum]|uniref:Late embryogeneis abundant protein n=4 Tax=Ancylostoma ceylanicum TaxID=53326 RepID=A0A016WNR1_9BILA|nr:hypothetical protein Y032_0603g530 [Ancylostoma ceylanicum]